jgi:hypothetical protein
MFPGLNPQVIAIVNSIIDNPPPWFSLLPQVGRLPTIRYRGHRVRGHDVLGASIAGLIAGRGVPGLAVVPLHLLLDMLRDSIVTRYGVSTADVTEDVLNLLLELLMENGKPTRKGRKTVSRKL